MMLRRRSNTYNGLEEDDVFSMPSGRQDQTSAVSAASALVTTTANSTTPGKGNRPRPLKLTGEANGHHFYDDHQAMNAEETIRLMHQINQAVKAGSLTSNLASQIFRLYSELRQHGEYLEQTHKEELGRVFLSLRQACCRDSGQLGTPCRLKIMELIELRAMGWRTNLAHSQYYMRGQTEAEAQQASFGVNDYGPVPVSAPPFGSVPVNPFGMGFQQPSPVTLGQHGPLTTPDAYGMGGGHQQPQFYIIPASNVAHTQAGIAFVTPGSVPGQPQPAPPGLAMRQPHPAAAAFAHPGGPFIPPQSGPNPMTMSQGSPISGGSAGSPGAMSMSTSLGAGAGFPKGAAWKTTGKFTRPQRVPGKSQYRDEIIIRNADSGKVMGIKGRRIAIIEELSKTIVSFQKVPPGAKERTLTITGSTEESIEKAKALLDQTIRRNASPTRAEGGEEGDDAELYAELALKMGEGDIYGLTCTDPKFLEVAKVALKEYFERHVSTRRSFNEDGLSKEERKERRKSMPPISQPDVSDLPEMMVDQLTTSDVEREKKLLFQSTPNLLQMPAENGHPPVAMGVDSSAADTTQNESTVVVQGTGGGDGSEAEIDRAQRAAMIMERMPKSKMRVVYTREFLLQCGVSPLAQVQPELYAHIHGHVEEVLRQAPGKFDPIEYKNAKPSPCPGPAVA